MISEFIWIILTMRVKIEELEKLLCDYEEIIDILIQESFNVY